MSQPNADQMGHRLIVGRYVWWTIARIFARGPALLSLVIPVFIFLGATFASVSVDSLLSRPHAEVMIALIWIVAGTITWLVLDSVALDAVISLRRLGFDAVLRSRWWFEMARLALVLSIVTFIANIALQAVADPYLKQSSHRRISDLVFDLPKVGAGIFVLCGLVGYCLCLVRWKRPSGRAFDWVHTILPLVGAGLCANFALDHWPPESIWPDGVAVVGFGAAGILSMIGWIVLGMKGWERLDRRLEVPDRS